MTTKRDIAQQMSEKIEIRTEDTVKYIEEILEILAEKLIENQYWELRNFGVFRLKQRSVRMGRNIHTGEQVPVAPYKDIVFKPGKFMIKRIQEAPRIVKPKPRKKV